jgi:MoaA/NifB/PqqE/SkfB family radical SAM enzyme
MAPASKTSGPQIGRHSPRRVDIREALAPLYVVWELTLKCDLACRHCGSRAGKARQEELSLTEAREVVAQLAELGTRELAFIGGEAYLYPEWLQIVSAARDAGIRPTMTSGARALDAEMCQRAADAGLEAISVSVDGLLETHDTLRAVKGSYQACIDALGHIRAAGMQPFANTQINRLNLHELPELTQVLEQAGILCCKV